MPRPHERRDSFVKYMRTGYAHHEPWIDGWGEHTAEDVKEALRDLAKTDGLLYRILNLYTISRMSRHKISERVNYDYSTVKRKLDHAIDIVLTRLANKDINKLLKESGQEAV